MARTPFDPIVIRPPCPRHPGSRIRLDGYWHCRWSPLHRRPRYRCVTEPGTRGHAFSVPVAVRQPTERHPDAGAACPACADVCARHEGVSTGRAFVFGHAEIARLLVRVGEGISLRAASADLRDHVLRSGPGGTSRQANLAVSYLDAYGPAVLAALHPTTWPRIVVLDTTTLFTRVPREAPDDTGAARVGNRRAGTVMVALDGTAGRPRPCLMAVAGAKDADSWRAFFGRLVGAPAVVVADLDAAIARAVRETWPDALLVPSRHHLAARIRERLIADGIPERVRLEAPVATRRALPWTGERVRRYGPHPLHEAALPALRGEAEWDAFLALVERHVPPDRLALRGWIATNEPLVRRGWLLRGRLGPIPLSTGALEGAIGKWLAPLRRRAGRWQNARRLDLVLGLMTLRARGDAREARYGALVRAAFAASGNRSHDPADAPDLGTEIVADRTRPVSWWRAFHDRAEPSLPRLVREADRRWRAQARADHLEWIRERLAERYATEVDLRTRLDLPVPPSGRPKRAQPRRAASVAGRRLADYPELVLEWAWDVNAGLDPATLPAGSRERVAWRCLLEPAHVWETRVSDRTYHGSGCPFHMGIRVHPAESLAAFYPWLAAEWHPERNVLRPDQVTRASAREVWWRCPVGHEWTTPVYQRTLSGSGCPDCYRAEAAARSKEGKARAREAREAAERVKIIELPRRVSSDGPD